MREYIHFFENSDLRDDYEYGSDYTEPYVSYTPVINEYKALVDGNNILGFNITKQKNNYLILSNDGNLIIMNPEPPIVNSNVFYTLIPFEASTKAVDSPATRMFIIEEDLLLTEESTEFTFNEVTCYLIQEDVNRWNVYTDSEHTQNNGILLKYDIVSVPSSTSTDFVHYNKMLPPKSIYAKIYIEEVILEPKGTSPLYVIISNKNDIFEKIIIDNGADVIDFSTQEEQTKTVDLNVYYQFNTYGIHNIEYVLKDEYAGIMPGGMIPSFGISFNEITLPKGIYKIESGAFDEINHTGNYLNLNIPDTINEVENNAVICIQISQEVTDLLLSINPNAIYSNCK